MRNLIEITQFNTTYKNIRINYNIGFKGP